MEAFLRETKDRLESAPGDSPLNIHVVLGNESCDLDSAVSALVWAYHLHKEQEVSGTKWDAVVPVLNIPFEDYHLRTEVKHFLSLVNNIGASLLVFRDDVDLPSQHASGKLTLTLVDHNVLPKRDASLDAAVREVIDHRSNSRQDDEDRDIQVTLEKVGSCSTLVAEKILAQNPETVDEHIAKLLLGPILVDTVNLSVSAGKATAKDIAMVEALSQICPDLNREEMHEELQQAKADMSDFSVTDILRKDFKCVSGSSMNIGMSSIPMDLKEFVEKPDIEIGLQDFCTLKNLRLLVLMALTVADDREAHRKICVYSSNSTDSMKDELIQTLEESTSPELDLSELYTNPLGLVVYSQGNVKASRKQVLPLVKNFLDSQEDSSQDDEDQKAEEGVATESDMTDINNTLFKLSDNSNNANEQVFGDAPLWTGDSQAVSSPDSSGIDAGSVLLDLDPFSGNQDSMVKSGSGAFSSGDSVDTIGITPSSPSSDAMGFGSGSEDLLGLDNLSPTQQSGMGDFGSFTSLSNPFGESTKEDFTGLDAFMSQPTAPSDPNQNPFGEPSESNTTNDLFGFDADANPPAPVFEPTANLFADPNRNNLLDLDPFATSVSETPVISSESPLEASVSTTVESSATDLVDFMNQLPGSPDQQLLDPTSDIHLEVAVDNADGPTADASTTNPFAVPGQTDNDPFGIDAFTSPTSDFKDQTSDDVAVASSNPFRSSELLTETSSNTATESMMDFNEAADYHPGSPGSGLAAEPSDLLDTDSYSDSAAAPAENSAPGIPPEVEGSSDILDLNSTGAVQSKILEDELYATPEITISRASSDFDQEASETENIVIESPDEPSDEIEAGEEVAAAKVQDQQPDVDEGFNEVDKIDQDVAFQKKAEEEILPSYDPSVADDDKSLEESIEDDQRASSGVSEDEVSTEQNREDKADAELNEISDNSQPDETIFVTPSEPVQEEVDTQPSQSIINEESLLELENVADSFVESTEEAQQSLDGSEQEEVEDQPVEPTAHENEMVDTPLVDSDLVETSLEAVAESTVHDREVSQTYMYDDQYEEDKDMVEEDEHEDATALGTSPSQLDPAQVEEVTSKVVSELEAVGQEAPEPDEHDEKTLATDDFQATEGGDEDQVGHSEDASFVEEVSKERDEVVADGTSDDAKEVQQSEEDASLTAGATTEMVLSDALDSENPQVQADFVKEEETVPLQEVNQVESAPDSIDELLVAESPKEQDAQEPAQLYEKTVDDGDEYMSKDLQMESDLQPKKDSRKETILEIDEQEEKTFEKATDDFQEMEYGDEDQDGHSEDASFVEEVSKERDEVAADGTSDDAKEVQQSEEDASLTAGATTEMVLSDALDSENPQVQADFVKEEETVPLQEVNQVESAPDSIDELLVAESPKEQDAQEPAQLYEKTVDDGDEYMSKDLQMESDLQPKKDSRKETILEIDEQEEKTFEKATDDFQEMEYGDEDQDGHSEDISMVEEVSKERDEVAADGTSDDAKEVQQSEEDASLTAGATTEMVPLDALDSENPQVQADFVNEEETVPSQEVNQVESAPDSIDELLVAESPKEQDAQEPAQLDENILDDSDDHLSEDVQMESDLQPEKDSREESILEPDEQDEKTFENATGDFQEMEYGESDLQPEKDYSEETILPVTADVLESAPVLDEVPAPDRSSTLEVLPLELSVGGAAASLEQNISPMSDEGPARSSGVTSPDSEFTSDIISEDPSSGDSYIVTDLSLEVSNFQIADIQEKVEEEDENQVAESKEQTEGVKDVAKSVNGIPEVILSEDVSRDFQVGVIDDYFTEEMQTERRDTDVVPIPTDVGLASSGRSSPQNVNEQAESAALQEEATELVEGVIKMAKFAFLEEQQRQHSKNLEEVHAEASGEQLYTAAVEEDAIQASETVELESGVPSSEELVNGEAPAESINDETRQIDREEAPSEVLQDELSSEPPQLAVEEEITQVEVSQEETVKTVDEEQPSQDAPPSVEEGEGLPTGQGTLQKTSELSEETLIPTAEILVQQEVPLELAQESIESAEQLDKKETPSLTISPEVTPNEEMEEAPKSPIEVNVVITEQGLQDASGNAEEVANPFAAGKTKLVVEDSMKDVDIEVQNDNPQASMFGLADILEYVNADGEVEGSTTDPTVRPSTLALPAKSTPKSTRLLSSGTPISMLSDIDTPLTPISMSSLDMLDDTGTDEDTLDRKEEEGASEKLTHPAAKRSVSVDTEMVEDIHGEWDDKKKLMDAIVERERKKSLSENVEKKSPQRTLSVATAEAKKHMEGVELPDEWQDDEFSQQKLAGVDSIQEEDSFFKRRVPPKDSKLRNRDSMLSDDGSVEGMSAWAERLAGEEGFDEEDDVDETSSPVNGRDHRTWSNSPRKVVPIPVGLTLSMEGDTSTPAVLTPSSAEMSWDDDTMQSPVVEPIPEYSAREEMEDRRNWRKVVIANKEFTLDMRAINPYKKVLSHGGYYGDGVNAIIVLASCYMPDRSRKDYNYIMNNLFLYVISTLELLVANEYVIVYFHGAAPKNRIPSLTWMRKCYQMIDRKLRKSLKGLYIVHPTMWLRTIIRFTRPFISSKFSRKLKFIETLDELPALVNMEYVYVPDEVRRFDEGRTQKAGGGGGVAVWGQYSTSSLALAVARCSLYLWCLLPAAAAQGMLGYPWLVLSDALSWWINSNRSKDGSSEDGGSSCSYTMGPDSDIAPSVLDNDYLDEMLYVPTSRAARHRMSAQLRRGNFALWALRREQGGDSDAEDWDSHGFMEDDMFADIEDDGMETEDGEAGPSLRQEEDAAAEASDENESRDLTHRRSVGDQDLEYEEEMDPFAALNAPPPLPHSQYQPQPLHHPQHPEEHHPNQNSETKTVDTKRLHKKGIRRHLKKSSKR